MLKLLYNINICLSTSFIFASLSIQAQQVFNNNGASVVVASGIDVKVDGGVSNTATGTILNEGDFYLTEDWVQNGGSNYTGEGWMWFEGTTDQRLTGPTSVPKLRVDNGNDVFLDNNVETAWLDLNNNGQLVLGTHNLTIQESGTIIPAVLTGYDATSFVVTNSSGVLKRIAAASGNYAGGQIFPIGKSSYNPVIVSNTGTSDFFSGRVEDQVWSFCTNGNGTREIQDIVDRAWFIDEEVTGGSNASVQVHWATAQELSGFDRTASFVSHCESGGYWDHIGPYTASTINLGLHTQTRTNVTNFSPFAVEDESDKQLPIELLEFTAKRTTAENVALNWTTANEVNNKGFEIQRALGTDIEFETVAWVNGSGTTSVEQKYTSNDPNNFTGTSYYRLKQIDFDGTYTYSAIRAVEGITTSGRGLELFPNPTQNTVYLKLAIEHTTNADIMVYTGQGRLVLHQKARLEVNQPYAINGLKDMPVGTYLFRILLEDGHTYSRLIVKQKD